MKKTGKLLALILAALMMVMPMPAGIFAADTYSDPELARAVTLGLGMYQPDNHTITFAQFFEILDSMVKAIDEGKLSAWENAPELQAARISDTEMTRSDGMFVTLCAAEILGRQYARYNNVAWPMLWEKLGNWDGQTGKNYKVNEEIFSGSFVHGTPQILFNPQDDYEERHGDALSYSFGRVSYTSGKLLFDYDAKNNSMRTGEPLTYTDALLAALRLHDSGSNKTPMFPTAEGEEIIANAEARKKAILDSPTDITVKGTEYYVSNSGSDTNDGKSPEKAWASIEKVSGANLKPGDGVFFERGGVWRDVTLFARTGVTYSAYGTGEKPQLLGSPENGANPDYWKLVPGTDNVWEYHIEMLEVGLMTVNDDELLDDKYIAFWDLNQQKYVVSLDYKTPFDVNLLENHQFFSKVDLSGLKHGTTGSQDFYNTTPDEDGVDLGGQYGDGLFLNANYSPGKFYFRCDEGNPGEVYDSIEFVEDTFTELSEMGKGLGLVWCANAEDVILDNLCLKYETNAAVLAIEKNTVIQNCEMAFMGGSAYNHMTLEQARLNNDQIRTVRDLVDTDDGCVIVSYNPTDMVIANNYVHDALNGAYNLEHALNGTHENIKINGNLFERTGYGMNMTNFFPNDDPGITRYKDIFIEDNFVMYTGYLSDRAQWGGAYPAHNYNFYHPQQYKNINYTNNVYYMPKGTMFMLVGAAAFDGFNFSGNTYAHRDYGVLLRDDRDDGGSSVMYDENAEKTIKELTGDKTAVVLSLSIAQTGTVNNEPATSAPTPTAVPTTTPKPAATPKPTVKPATGKPVDKPFNSEAQTFFGNLPDGAKEGITWTRKSMDGIEYIEAFKDNAKQKPLIFVLHGGGGKKEDILYALDMYAHENLYAVGLDVAAYGDSDRGPMPIMDAWLETVGYIDTLIDFYKDNANADNSRFAVGGDSMGGAITFLYGVKGVHTPSLLMPEVGAADYTKIFNGRANDIVYQGEPIDTEEITPELTAKAEELSAVNNVDKFVDIPMWANFGELDIDGGVEGAVEFIRLLKEAGGTIQHLEIIKGGGHGDFPDELDNGKMDYIRKHLKIQY